MDSLLEKRRKFLLDFREKYLCILEDGTQRSDTEFLSKQLRNAIVQLSEGLYSKDVHFILELIQNAEDNPYGDAKPELEFLVLTDDPTNTPESDGCLCLFNNEKGFEEDNFKSICSINDSTKDKRLGYIGEKGIGFKSVFTVCSQPHIYSNGFQFCFKEKDPKHQLGYIVPYWLENVPDVVKNNNAKTTILLPLKPEKRNEIITEFESIQPETILFLNKLEALTIEIKEAKSRIELKKYSNKINIINLSVKRNSSQETTSTFWNYKKTVSVPGDLKEGKREGVTDREMSIAFPLGSDNMSGAVYAFLPTEIDSGMPFIINADFIVPASRESINVGNKWNLWLRDELSKAIVEGIEGMLVNDDYQKHAYKYIPIVDKPSGLRRFFAPIGRDVCSVLKGKKCILAEDGKMVMPENARFSSKELRALFRSTNKPNIFNSLSFVDADIEKFKAQLKEIGVVDFTVEEMKVCLSDIDWLSTKKSEWYFDLYQFLRDRKQYNKQELSSLSIIYLDGDSLTSPGKGPVYIPGPKESVVKLRDVLKKNKLPDVDFLHKELVAQASNDKSLEDWFTNHLNVKIFSIRAFIIHTLLPWTKLNIENLKLEQALCIAQIILDNLQKIEEGDYEVIKTNLPIVLCDGSIALRENLEGVELLVPRGLDKKLGWQNILVNEEDYSHEDILSDEYLKSNTADDVLKSFFQIIGAETYPDLKKQQFQLSEASAKSIYSPYVKAERGNFPSNYTSTPTLFTWASPLFFYAKEYREKSRHRKAFIYWLEAMIENRSKELRHGKITWYYRTNYIRETNSALYYELQKQPWLQTSKGIKRPGEVFVKNNQLYEMFKGNLPYLKDKLSPELIEFLGIHTDATTEAIINYLKVLSENKTADKALVVKLYLYLNEFGRDYTNSFQEYALIYVPQSKNKWHKSGEVIWEDFSEIFGDLYNYLEPVYEKNNLEGFFTKKLSVSRTVNTEELVRAWIHMQQIDNPEPEKIREALRQIYPKIVEICRDLSKPPDWWESFVSEVQIWTSENQFVDPEVVMAGDNRQIRRLFEDNINFIWLPERYSHDELDLFYKALGIQRISQAVDISLESPKNTTKSDDPKFLNPWSKRLLAYYIYNKSTEHFDQMIANGVMLALMQGDEYTCQKLVLNYEIESWFQSRTDDSKTAYWDSNEARLYLQDNSDEYDLLDDAAEAIARELWGRRYKIYESEIQRILQTNRQERFQKLKDKYDWNMPIELRNELFNLIEKHEIDAEEKSDSNSNEVIEAVSEPVAEGEDTNEQQGYGEKSGELESEKAQIVNGNAGMGESRNTNTQVAAKNRNNSGVRGNSSYGYSGADGTSSGSSKTRGTRISTARSQDINQKINSVRQSRLPVYVYQNDRDISESNDSQEAQKRREDIGEAAEDFVYKTELEVGHKVRRMEKGHHGYDIEVIDKDTGEMRFIEVKGQDGVWGSRGVSLSARQYKEARDKGEAFWLYVVENARSQKPSINKIQNPFARVTHFQFDASWSQLSEVNILEKSDQPYDVHELVDELKSYTDDEICKSLIDLCNEKDVELPKVGCDVTDEKDAIVGQIELVWTESKVALILNEQEEQIQYLQDEWSIFRLDELKTQDNLSESKLFQSLVSSQNELS